jgi:hypothetical protein
MHMPPFEKVAYYRRRAQEVRDTAARISLTSARERLLETARHLEMMAEAEEHRHQEMSPIWAFRVGDLPPT